MQFHAYTSSGAYLIHDKESQGMAQYGRIDPALVARQRKANIMAGNKVIPKLACNYCGHGIGKGALWCCGECAQLYEAERKSIIDQA